MLSEQNNLKDISLYISKSNISTKGNNTGSWRFVCPEYDEKTAPCSSACPAGEDIARIEMLAAKGMFQQAWETIIRENPFPAVCGRVCFHTCEQACNRKELDQGIAIHNLERLIGDMALRENYQIPTYLNNNKLNISPKKHIAIAGAGPFGLAAAWFLSMLGYSCDIFESENEPGGILRWGIPLYRLPRDILKYEINRIIDQNFINKGIKIFCNKTFTKDLIDKNPGLYDAVFMGCGYGKSLNLGIPGKDMALDGLKFLHDSQSYENNTYGNNTETLTAVIGGGNTAIDVARSLKRTGAKPVIVYRRRKQDMPAFAHEVEMALEEGIELMELLSPVSIEKNNGEYILKLQKMKTIDMEVSSKKARVVPDENKTEILLVDRIFTAIGAEPMENWYCPPENQTNVISLSHCTFWDKKLPVVFGGDLASPVKSVTDAIASGKQAAIALDTYFKEGTGKINETIKNCSVGTGSSISMEIYLAGQRKERSPHVVSFDEINTDYFSVNQKQEAPVLFPNERAKTFAEVEAGYDRESGLKEALRCFNCGICNDCDNCRIFCPDAAVIVKNIDKINKTRYINLDYCKGCGICVVECPRNAMCLKEEKI